MEKDKLVEEHTRLKDRQFTGFTVLFLYSVLITAVLVGGAYQMVKFADQLHDLSNTVQTLKENCAVERLPVPLAANESKKSKDRREVLSSKVKPEDVASLLRGPPGPAGPPGKDGMDGQDASSILAIEKIVTTTASKVVQEEWTKVSSTIPNYGGATFVRWGKKTCPDQSKFIYSGLAGGSDYKSPGGGVNYQCLPSDPEYDPKYSNINLRSQGMRGVSYGDDASQSILGANMYRRQVPCAVCEAKQRVTKLMIPAKIRCPSKEWTMEYKGFLVAQPNHDIAAPGKPPLKAGIHYRTTYECLDENPEPYIQTSTPTINYEGGLLYLTSAMCLGPASLNHCPPYQNRKVLSCVVCTK